MLKSFLITLYVMLCAVAGCMLFGLTSRIIFELVKFGWNTI